MLTVIIRRDADADTIQLTQKNVMRELWSIPGSEMLTTNTWREGLRQVRTPYVCLIESDATLSSSYLSSNYGLMKKMTPVGGGKGSNPNGGIGGKRTGTGGYTKLVMLSSCLGIKDFGNRIYNYRITEGEWSEPTKDGISTKGGWKVEPNRNKVSNALYSAQIGFVPGAIIRYSVVKDLIDTFDWDYKNLIEMSAKFSTHLWGTNRRLQVNPNTTYVTTADYLEHPPTFKIPYLENAYNIFSKEDIS